MIVRKTTPEEARRVNELFAICFEMPLTNCPANPDGDDSTHWASLDDNGEMMSTFTISDFSVQFDGHPCKMGGIGGVATLPQYRRSGGIRSCFQAALPDMYRQDYDFSYLYPFSTGYYRKFGYECCCQGWQWQVNLSLLNPPKDCGIFRLVEPNHPQVEAIQALDVLWERKYNMMVQHDAADYDWVTKADPAVKQEFTYVCYAPSGDPSAYVSFRLVNEPSGRNLHCHRFCFANKQGFQTILALFKSLAADHAYVKFQTPVDTGLQYLMPEWSQGAVSWELQASRGMVRVVNVRRVLEKAAYRGSGTVALEIQDPQIPENTGTFAVTFADGKAVTVAPTSDSPDAVLTIPAFSALISGICDLSDAEGWLNGLELRNPAAPLSQVFYRKPLWIVDYF